MFNLRLVEVTVEKTHLLPEFYFAIGKSLRGVHHVVIYSNGKMVHDPHYANDGIIEPECYEFLEPITEHVQD